MSVGAEREEALERRIDALASAVAELTSRVASLEAGHPAAAGDEGPAADLPLAVATVDAEPIPDLEEAADAPVEGPTGQNLMVLFGRTLLVLGGAFLLRSLTEKGVIDPKLGVLLGFVYASVWLVLANRAAGEHHDTDAAFHGATTTIIAFPLVWETGVKLHILGPWLAAVALTAMSGGLLYLAWSRKLRPLGAIVSLAALGTAIAMMLALKAVAPFSLALAAIVAAILAASYNRRWTALRVVTAAMVDGFVLVSLIVVASGASQWLTRPAVAAVGGGLAVLFLAAFFVATTWRGVPLQVFEIVQSVVVLAIGIVGGLAVAGPGSTAGLALGMASTAGGLAAYAAALLLDDRLPDANVLYAEAVASFLVILGVMVSLDVPWPGLVLGLGAPLLAAVSAREKRGTLRLHAAILAAAAAVGSGALGWMLAALARADGAAEAGFPPVALAVIALIAATYLVLRRCGGAARTPGTWTAPTVVLLVISGLGVAALMVAAAGAAFPDAVAKAGLLAVIRTAALTAATWALAACLSLGAPGHRELAWSAYALLGITGLKVVMEDLPRGTPGTLTVTFLLVGLTLVMAPRLLRSRMAGPATRPASRTDDGS